VPEKQHNPHEVITVHGAADSDTDPEVLGTQKDGSVIDSQNMRPTGLAGHANY